MSQSSMTGKPEGIPATWKPRLPKTPVPIMFATTMAMAVASPTRATPGGRLFLASVMVGSGGSRKGVASGSQLSFPPSRKRHLVILQSPLTHEPHPRGDEAVEDQLGIVG